MIDFIHAPDDNDPSLSAQLADEAATLALGAKLAAVLEPALKIWLVGDLGSGKTTLTRGVLRALGHQGPVKSPTYSLIEPYVVSRLNLYHFDFYRMNFPEEFLDAGLEEYFSGTGVCIVEWPQLAAPYLATPDVVIALAVHETGRQATITAKTETGQRCIDRLTGNTTSPQTAPAA
jgi:tRNA threonylcarbamoyladenosine biosynthesis protein TsaE